MNRVALTLIRRIVPELVDVLWSRARILQRLRLLQPIGRRALAQELGVTERVLRGEVDILRRQGLIVSGPSGMSLSDEGLALLEQLEQVLAAIEGRAELGRRLSAALGIPSVVVVAGDSDEEAWVKDMLGYHAAVCLREHLLPGDVVAVSGGSTMAALAKRMPERAGPPGVKVVPARGGLGEAIALEANTIAAELAARLGGTSVMLHVPDYVREETLQHLLEEPDIEQRIAEVRAATVVVHGIGGALQMAARRGLPAAEQAKLVERGAVAEAFGYYFDRNGRTVLAMSVIGLRLADLRRARLVMAVAGGRSKAGAIAAAAKAYRIDVLVTDEGAGHQILSMQTEGDVWQSK
ncbi:central glycolytic genes regulator [Alicyclobacillus cellulosilyticus]|uniref:Central glycolytic genes regulator n=1 Tax=Alicyclobacillus cellulosilyticus TaxID=1003997 RepID=A0A917K5B3_9BACL|nr:sugar-binding domain-containing protein [Alicyclobacillus cellulosilyticus]GGI99624.1 central glycolytic genes regulator [Alicyclobacillus cellulosilyticus]